MPEFTLIGRPFLLPPQENEKRLRARVTKKAAEEIEDQEAIESQISTPYLILVRVRLKS